MAASIWAGVIASRLGKRSGTRASAAAEVSLASWDIFLGWYETVLWEEDRCEYQGITTVQHANHGDVLYMYVESMAGSLR
jgi:hypothetical protein